MHKLIYLLVFLSLSSCVVQEQTELVFDDTNAPGRSIASQEAYPLNLQISNRKYVFSVLQQVFEIEEKTTEWNQLVNDIYKKVEFGGGCDIYKSSDLDVYTYEYSQEVCGGISTTQTATSNPMRYSLTLKSCEYLLSRSSILNTIKSKISSDSSWPEVNSDSVAKIWNEFYPLEELNSELYESLKLVSDESSSDEEKWKLITFTVCSSPGWQVL